MFKKKNYKLINDLKSIKEHDYYQNLLLPKIYFDRMNLLKNVNFIKSEKEIDNKWRTKLKDDNKFKVEYFGKEIKIIMEIMKIYTFKRIWKNNI